MTTPPFTGWVLNRAADRVELLHIYLQKLKHAKNIEGRMLVHAEFAQMQMEKFGAVAKEINDALAMSSAIFGNIIQVFRHKQRYEEMAQRNAELEKPTNNLEERLIAIERQLKLTSDENRSSS